MQLGELRGRKRISGPLAAHRQAEGLPATSLAWGLWAQSSNTTFQDMDEAELARISQQIRARLGFAPMSQEQGMAFFDAALGLPEPLLVPAAFDGAALRAQASTGFLPPILRGLVRVPTRARMAPSRWRIAWPVFPKTSGMPS